MADFSSTLLVQAPPEAVCDFVVDVKNLPKYLPTIKSAESTSADHVKVHGEMEDDEYTGEGFFRTVEPNRKLEWGSEDHDYNGSMEFSPDGTGTNVTIRLHMNPPEDRKQGMEEKSGGDWAGQMQEGIERSLHSIKNHVEGTGGKDEVPESR